jgi:hypothetical protein
MSEPDMEWIYWECEVPDCVEPVSYVGCIGPDMVHRLCSGHYQEQMVEEARFWHLLARSYDARELAPD